MAVVRGVTQYLHGSAVGFNVDDISRFHAFFLKTLINTGVQLKKQEKRFSSKTPVKVADEIGLLVPKWVSQNTMWRKQEGVFIYMQHSSGCFTCSG